jgi:hypothetical protein
LLSETQYIWKPLSPMDHKVSAISRIPKDG